MYKFYKVVLIEVINSIDRVTLAHTRVSYRFNSETNWNMSYIRILYYIYLTALTSKFIYYCANYGIVWFEILDLEKKELLYLYNDTIKGNEILLQKLDLVDISSTYHNVCFPIFMHKYGLEHDTATLIYKYTLLTDVQLSEVQQLIDLKNHKFVKDQLNQ